MKSSQSLALIYEIAEAQIGAEDAKKTLSGVLFSIISELEAAQVPVTPENIDKSLAFVAENFARAAKKYAA